MAAVEADRVVVALEAQLANYQAKVSGAGATFDKSMSQIEKGAARAEAATRRLANSVANDTGRAANASRNLGRQIADIGVGLSSGQSPFIILAQQAPQVADALADTQGKAASLARFFAGPWGAALLAAGSIAGVFFGKLLDGGEAAKKQKDNLQRLTEALQEYQRTSGEAVSNDYVRIRLMEVLTQRIADQTLKIRENIKANLERARSADAAARFTGGGVAGQVGNPAVAALASQLVQANKDLAEARRNARVAGGNRITADQDRNGQGADSIAASAAKVKNAQDHYAIVLNNLSVGLRKGDLTQQQFNEASLKARRAMEKVVNAPALDRKDQAAERAAQAAARKAEAARLKAVKDEDAFQTALNKATLELLGVRADLTADSRVADELQRKQIEQARKDANRDVATEGPGGTNRFSAAEVKKLQGLNDEIAAQKTLLVNRKESIRAAQEDLALVTSGLDDQRSIVQAQAALADSTAARRDAALKLLDLDDQLQRAQLEAVIASKEATETQKKIAQQRLDTLSQTRPERQSAVERANASPLGQYLQSLPDTADKLNDALESVAENGLKSLTDGITDAIMHAHSLADVFHDVAGQIIADLLKIAIQRAIVEPLANALFSAGGGGGSASGIASIFGRASGGYVNGGQMYRVNEGGSPGRVEGFVPQGSGKIIPLGRMNAASRGGGTTIVNQSFHLDARYGITTPELLTHINEVASSAASQAGAAAFRAGQAAVPGRMQKLQTLGS
jgi:hypothetical protein